MARVGLTDYVQRMATLPGVCGAALVDAESGMVFERAGVLPDIEQLSEVAVEFWRLYARQRRNLSSLGTLRSLLVQCDAYSLKLQPADDSVAEKGLVCVLVIDWHQQQPKKTSAS